MRNFNRKMLNKKRNIPPSLFKDKNKKDKTLDEIEEGEEVYIYSFGHWTKCVVKKVVKKDV